MSVSANGPYTVIHTDFGLSVSYDGWSTVSISVPSNYRYIFTAVEFDILNT